MNSPPRSARQCRLPPLPLDRDSLVLVVRSNCSSSSPSSVDRHSGTPGRTLRRPGASSSRTKAVRSWGGGRRPRLQDIRSPAAGTMSRFFSPYSPTELVNRKARRRFANGPILCPGESSSQSADTGPSQCPRRPARHPAHKVASAVTRAGHQRKGRAESNCHRPTKRSARHSRIARQALQSEPATNWDSRRQQSAPTQRCGPSPNDYSAWQ